MPPEVNIVKVTALAVVNNIITVRIDLINVIVMGKKVFIYVLWMMTNKQKSHCF
jgi:hypothetical protein